MDLCADGDEAQREHVARPDRVRAENTHIEAARTPCFVFVVAEALHDIARRHAVWRKDVALAATSFVLDQCDMGAAAGVVFEAHHLLLAAFPTEKVDQTDAAAVATAAATHGDVSVVVTATGAALRHREQAHRAAAVEMSAQRNTDPSNRRCDGLERFELVVGAHQWGDSALCDTKSRCDRRLGAPALGELAALLGRTAPVATKRPRRRVLLGRRRRKWCTIGAYGHCGSGSAL